MQGDLFPELPSSKYEIVFVTFITIKGRRIYAKERGLKAFPIRVRKRK